MLIIRSSPDGVLMMIARVPRAAIFLWMVLTFPKGIFDLIAIAIPLPRPDS